MVAGALAGFIHLVPEPGRRSVVLGSVAVVLAFELAGRPLHLPQNHRQVPQSITARATVDGPLQFGFEMGTGVRTYMPTALPHALLLTVLLIGGLGPGLVAGLGFGLGRALMPLTRARAPHPAAWDTLLLRRLRLIGRLCAVGFLLAFAVLLLGQ